MNTWILRGSALGALSAGLVVAGASAASAAPVAAPGDVHVPGIVDSAGRAVPAELGQAGMVGDTALPTQVGHAVPGLVDAVSGVRAVNVGRGGDGGPGGSDNTVEGGSNTVGNGGQGGTSSNTTAKPGPTLDRVGTVLGIPNSTGLPEKLVGGSAGLDGISSFLANRGADGGKGGSNNVVRGVGNRIANGGSVLTPDAPAAPATGATPSTSNKVLGIVPVGEVPNAGGPTDDLENAGRVIWQRALATR